MIWFKKKDPVCGMKQETGKGKDKYGQWFCSENCLKRYEKGIQKTKDTTHGCCH